MANSAQAKKRIRQAARNRLRNVDAMSRMRTHVKNVVKAIASGDKTAAESAYKAAVPIIDSTARKGMIHPNKAARHKSRLNSHIRQMQA